MYDVIKVGFNVDATGINLLKTFAINHETSAVITAQTQLNELFLLNVTVLSNHNELLFAIYSVVGHSMVNIEVNTGELRAALKDLELRFERALTRKPPKVNKELGLMWVQYLQQNPDMFVIPL